MLSMMNFEAAVVVQNRGLCRNLSRAWGLGNLSRVEDNLFATYSILPLLKLEGGRPPLLSLQSFSFDQGLPNGLRSDLGVPVVGEV